MKKNGFTLVEVLMSLLIIALISTILIPSITKLKPNRNKVMFKKAYYSLESAINLLITDDLLYPSDQKLKFGEITYSRGFNYTKAITNGSTNKFCYNLSEAFNTIGTVVCPAVGDTTSTSAVTGRGFFTTTDGIFWNAYTMVSDTTNNSLVVAETTAANTTSYQFPVNSTLYQTKIVVDVDGVKNGDNCSTDASATSYRIVTSSAASEALTQCPTYSATACTKAPDRYIIGIRYDGKIQIGSAAGADYCAESILSNFTDNT